MVAPALPPDTPRRPATVYACDGCDARQLGQQRCEEYRTLMRRIGIGGLCPFCDEPVKGHRDLPGHGQQTGPVTASKSAHTRSADVPEMVGWHHLPSVRSGMATGSSRWGQWPPRCDLDGVPTADAGAGLAVRA